MPGKGRFITFEGPEGAGKTTQLNLLREFLEKRGFECVVTREPGGTPMAEKLREMVKFHGDGEPVYDETELLLFEAARAQHVNFLIRPAVERGAIVLCDRFYDSTTAYQGYARKQNLEFIRGLNEYATGGFKPDLTILLDLPPETGFERTAERQPESVREDRLEAESLAFHRRVRNGFHCLAELEPERFRIVSAIGKPEYIHREIAELVQDVTG